MQHSANFSVLVQPGNLLPTQHANRHALLSPHFLSVDGQRLPPQRADFVMAPNVTHQFPQSQHLPVSHTTPESK